MPTEKLTDRRVKTVKAPAGSRLELWDANMPGLGLRIAPDGPQSEGVKTWFVRYRFAGAQRRLKLGTYPALSLSKAHDAARDVFGKVAHGIDPAAERERQPEPERDSFGVVAEQFIERHVKVKLRPVTVKNMTAMINKELVGVWGKRPIHSITRRDVIELLDAIVDRGSPVTANRVLAAARKMFNWAIERDIITDSPCDRMKPPGVERERQRVLSDDEIRLIWKAAAAKGPVFGSLVRVCLLTAQRKGETTMMRWRDIDVERRLWTIPREVTKGDRAHEVPLSPLALKVILEQPRVGDYVFPGRETKAEKESHKDNDQKGKPFNGFSKSKDRLDAKVLEIQREEAKEHGDDPDKVKPLEDWTIHDLRRTAATGMARLGVPRLVISKIENHVEGGVTKLYDRYAYEAEKRGALDRWGAKVESIVNPPPANAPQLRTERDADRPMEPPQPRPPLHAVRHAMAETPRIETVSIAGTVLTVGWRDGTTDTVDIAGWLARPGPAELDILKDPAVLANPKVANWGTVVAWDEDGDIGIDNIHLRLIAEQQKPFGAVDIAVWQERPTGKP